MKILHPDVGRLRSDPSPAMIAHRARLIRQGWSERERDRRSGRTDGESGGVALSHIREIEVQTDPAGV